MKFNITAKETWFWRIGIVVALVLSLVNYSDNRKQDKLLFKVINESITTQDQIKQLSEFDANENEINTNNMQIINKLLSK